MIKNVRKQRQNYRIVFPIYQDATIVFRIGKESVEQILVEK